MLARGLITSARVGSAGGRWNSLEPACLTSWYQLKNFTAGHVRALPNKSFFCNLVKSLRSLSSLSRNQPAEIEESLKYTSS